MNEETRKLLDEVVARYPPEERESVRQALLQHYLLGVMVGRLEVRHEADVWRLSRAI